MTVDFEALIYLSVSLVVAYALFWLSSRRLLNEAKKLRHMNKLILLGLENAELIELARDKNGEPVGLSVTVHLEAAAATVKGSGETKTT